MSMLMLTRMFPSISSVELSYFSSELNIMVSSKIMKGITMLLGLLLLSLAMVDVSVKAEDIDLEDSDGDGINDDEDDDDDNDGIPDDGNFS